MSKYLHYRTFLKENGILVELDVSPNGDIWIYAENENKEKSAIRCKLTEESYKNLDETYKNFISRIISEVNSVNSKLNSFN
jgi:exosome complex RNA-binding protein Rrp4